MVKEKVCFRATKVVRKPVRVEFKTKSGKTVAFKATKLQRKQVKVCFSAKKRRK